MKKKSKEVLGVLIDVKNDNVSKKIVNELDLDDFYNALDCRCIDITERMINGQRFTFVCDDEGLLIDNPIVSALSSSLKPMLVGNLFVCKTDGAYLKSLTEKEIDFVGENIIQCISMKGGVVTKSPAIKNVEYLEM